MKCKVIDVTHQKVKNKFLPDLIGYEFITNLHTPYGVLTHKGITFKGIKDVPVKGEYINYTHRDTIKRLGDRLNKLNIHTEFGGNFPWIYLEKVNGIEVKGKFQSDHHFTAFMSVKGACKWTDMSVVFDKIRETLEEQYGC